MEDQQNNPLPDPGKAPGQKSNFKGCILPIILISVGLVAVLLALKYLLGV